MTFDEPCTPIVLPVPRVQMYEVLSIFLPNIDSFDSVWSLRWARTIPGLVRQCVTHRLWIVCMIKIHSMAFVFPTRMECISRDLYPPPYTYSAANCCTTYFAVDPRALYCKVLRTVKASVPHLSVHPFVCQSVRPSICQLSVCPSTGPPDCIHPSGFMTSIDYLYVYKNIIAVFTINVVLWSNQIQSLVLVGKSWGVQCPQVNYIHCPWSNPSCSQHFNLSFVWERVCPAAVPSKYNLGHHCAWLV